MPIGALSAAASGLAFQDLKVRVISNNIANMNTSSFKRASAIAVDQPYQVYQSSGTPTSAEGTTNPTGTYVGMGVSTAGVMRSMEQGDEEMTDSPLDVMIKGEGYFSIELPTGEIGYTRDGRFTLSSERQLVTMSGYKAKPDITIPANTTSIDINKDGQVYAQVQGTTGAVLVGQFELAVFPSPGGLDPMGDNLFKESTSSGAPTTGNAGTVGFGNILQSAIEGSNVKPVVELTALIEAQRAYAMNTKTMNAVEEMDRNLETLMR